jgi:hypothetical protein
VDYAWSWWEKEEQAYRVCRGDHGQGYSRLRPPVAASSHNYSLRRRFQPSDDDDEDDGGGGEYDDFEDM